MPPWSFQKQNKHTTHTMEDDYVTVWGDESMESESMEFPLESDGTLTLSTVQSHFPYATGLKYRGPSGKWRGTRIVGNKIQPPFKSDVTYHVTPNKRGKDFIDTKSVFSIFLKLGTSDWLIQYRINATHIARGSLLRSWDDDGALEKCTRQAKVN